MLAFLIGLFKALLSVFMDHPREPDKEEVRDVGRKQPDNPDDIFLPSDFDS